MMEPSLSVSAQPIMSIPNLVSGTTWKSKPRRGTESVNKLPGLRELFPLLLTKDDRPYVSRHDNRQQKARYQPYPSSPATTRERHAYHVTSPPVTHPSATTTDSNLNRQGHNHFESKENDENTTLTTKSVPSSRETSPLRQAEGQFVDMGRILPSKPRKTTTQSPKQKINDGQWSEDEHKRFLEGLRVCGKGKWRAIADNFVKTRTRIQVASHAQKYFMKKEKRK